MSREFTLLPRAQAKLALGVGAVAAFGLALYTSVVESMPELHFYDGYWMILGAAVALAITAPLVWRLRRALSLPIVILMVILGSWTPLLVSALRRNMDVLARLEGARYLMAADVVSAAIAVGAACLWMALREPGKG